MPYEYQSSSEPPSSDIEPTSPSRTPHPRFGSALARAQAIDLRRRLGRERAETLVARSEYLDPADRALIHAVFRQGTSVAELARASGASAKRLRARLRSISERVLSPAFAAVVTGSDRWPANLRRVALEVIVKGHTLRQTAQTLGLTHATVRAHRQAALTIINAERAPTKPGAKP